MSDQFYRSLLRRTITPLIARYGREIALVTQVRNPNVEEQEDVYRPWKKTTLGRHPVFTNLRTEQDNQLETLKLVRGVFVPEISTTSFGANLQFISSTDALDSMTFLISGRDASFQEMENVTHIDDPGPTTEEGATAMRWIVKQKRPLQPGNHVLMWSVVVQR